MAETNIEEYRVTEEQVKEVSKIIGSENFILFANDPKMVDQGLVGSTIIRNMSKAHMHAFATSLLSDVATIGGCGDCAGCKNKRS